MQKTLNTFVCQYAGLQDKIQEEEDLWTEFSATPFFSSFKCVI